MTNEDLTKEVFALDERTSRHAEQIKTIFNQIAETKCIAESVHKLATTVELLAREMKSTNEKVDKISGEIEEIKEKPAKRWDNVITVAITVFATAVITYFLSQLGLK